MKKLFSFLVISLTLVLSGCKSQQKGIIFRGSVEYHFGDQNTVSKTPVGDPVPYNQPQTASDASERKTPVGVISKSIQNEWTPKKEKFRIQKSHDGKNQPSIITTQKSIKPQEYAISDQILQEQTTEESHRNADGWMAAIAGFSLLAGGLMTRKMVKRTASLSKWAAQHKNSARAILATLHAVLSYASFEFGRALLNLGFETTEMLEWIGGAAIIGGFADLYIQEKKKNIYNLNQMYRQKRGHMVIATALAVTLTTAGNRFEKGINQTNIAGHFLSSLTNQFEDDRQERHPYFSEHKIQKFEDNNLKITGIVLGYLALILLTLVGFFLLTCSLACSGYGFLAVIAAVGGLTLSGVLVYRMALAVQEVRKKK